MSSRGLVTYGVAKVLTKILQPLVGRPPHHIHRSQNLVEQANKVTLLPGKCLSSYDVAVSFTSVPVEPALGITKYLLEQDSTLKERIVLLVKDIILLLNFYPHNTYFSFQGQFYEQVEGAAMGSWVHPIVTNLYMEYFEKKALSTATYPQDGLGMWMTQFVIQKEDHKQKRP